MVETSQQKNSSIRRNVYVALKQIVWFKTFLFLNQIIKHFKIFWIVV